MYGYSSHEAVGCVSYDLLKIPSEIDDIESMLAKDGARNGEIEHTTKDGRKLIIETSHQVILNEPGQQVVLETNRDITERKRIEETMRESEERLRRISEATRIGLFEWNASNGKTYWSKAAYELFGIEPHCLASYEVLGFSIMAYFKTLD